MTMTILRPAPLFLLPLFLLVTLVGCRSSTEPLPGGAVELLVRDVGSLEPLQGVEASVSLEDGEEVGQSDESGTVRLDFLPAGTHQVTVGLSGYDTRSETVTIDEDEVVAIELFLHRTGANQPGSLSASVAEWRNAGEAGDREVEVDYTVVNPGDRALTSFDFTVRVRTAAGDQVDLQVQGDTLRAGETLTGSLAETLGNDSADQVTVGGMNWTSL